MSIKSWYNKLIFISFGARTIGARTIGARTIGART